jgi:hypothetical protein
MSSHSESGLLSQYVTDWGWMISVEFLVEAAIFFLTTLFRMTVGPAASPGQKITMTQV